MNRSMIVCAGAMLALLSACGPGSDQSQNAAVNAATASAEAANASATASVAANSAATAAASAAQTAAASTANAANSAAAVTATPAPLPAMSAADFVAKAAATDRYEIAAAKMAVARARDASVKAFAQMMIRDHTASTAKLKAAIAASGQALTPPRDLPADLQADLQSLRTASGADFDRGYVGQMVDTHDAALQTMQTCAAEGNVPAFKAFAAAVIPVVQSHLAKAQALQAKIGN